MTLQRLCSITLLLVLLATGPAAADWPQFHGPNRDNLSTGTGLAKSWPEDGPPLVWRAAGLGHGFGTMAIADGRIYTAGNMDHKTIITAMDLDGKPLWQMANGPAYEEAFPGARSTPTVVDGKLYHINSAGDVARLDAVSGKLDWTVNILKTFNGRNIRWGLAESLLVDGQNVLCVPGGEKIGLVALDKDSGETVWTCEGIGDRPSYSSPIVFEHDGLRQIVTMTGAAAVGVSADDGRLLWRHPREAPFEVNVATPVYHEGHVAVSCTWGRGTTLLKLNVDGRDCSAEQVWHTTEFDNEHGGFVLLDGRIYGFADGNHRDEHWACLDWATGKVVYAAEPQPNRSASFTYADGMFYTLTDKGLVTLTPATPDGFTIVSSFSLPMEGEGPTWAHPVVCGGRLYIRHGEFLYAFDVKG